MKKKILSVFLLAILLFNSFGYRLMTSFLENQANLQLETALDNNSYDESQLVSIKIPVAYLPYYNNSKSFERVNGQVEIEGVMYKYVKRRIFNDSLELLCIPNHAAMKLQVARNEFFKFVNDLQHPDQNKSQHSGASRNMAIDYYTAGELFSLSILHSVSISFSPYLFGYTSPFVHGNIQPPEHALKA